MTLQQIFNYANTLTEDAFGELADIIEYLNEAQDLVARFDRVRAAPIEFTLTTNSVTLPADLMQVERMTYKLSADSTVEIPFNQALEPWGSVLTLPTTMTSGVLTVWYYKIPATLLSTTPTQVPEVGAQYHRSLAVYAAKNYFMVDDDPAMREAYKAEFIGQLQSMRMSSGVVHNFHNF